MLTKLDEGVAEDLENLQTIVGKIHRTDDNKWLPYVQINRKDGTELHVHASPEPLGNRGEAHKIAADKAEKMIKAATGSASGS